MVLRERTWLVDRVVLTDDEERLLTLVFDVERLLLLLTLELERPEFPPTFDIVLLLKLSFLLYLILKELSSSFWYT